MNSLIIGVAIIIALYVAVRLGSPPVSSGRGRLSWAGRSAPNSWLAGHGRVSGGHEEAAN